MKNKIFIIAEAGVNHNGSLDTALAMVEQAARAGADAIKFQTFRAGSMVSRFAAKAAYQKKNAPKDETQLAMIRKLELSCADHRSIIAACQSRKIDFLSSPFDLESIELLARLGLGIFKIPSGEITNHPYLKKIGALRKKVILSSGMSEMAEIKEALDVLVLSGTKKGDIIVLHCVSEYPLPAKFANLKAMAAIKKAFGVSVGYSDHTLGIEMSIAAAALGACVIEKHFTLDRNMPGPDQALSIVPEELKRMVCAIRNVEAGLGSGIKKPTRQEEKIKKVVRKSIVARANIARGQSITAAMLDIKRPGTGIAPGEFERVLGRVARRKINCDTLVKFSDLR